MLKKLNNALRIVAVATALTAVLYVVTNEPKAKEDDEFVEGDAVSSEFDDSF